MFIENHKITYKNSICSPLETSKNTCKSDLQVFFLS